MFSSPAAGVTRTQGACPGDGPQVGAATVGGDETPGVTRIVFQFVDRSRPSSPDGLRRDAQPCRTLPTAVRIPSGTTTPLPLILVVHGRDGDPTRLRPLIDTWVADGYVVAAPFFLRTNKDARAKPTGAAVSRQAADARFVLTQLLDLDADPDSLLYGHVDPAHIGAAGMSLGGMTVYGLASNTCCLDPRINAAILLAAVHRSFGTGRYVAQDLPVMLIQGDHDKGYHNSLDAYPELTAPKWFITLHGSSHSPPFEIPRGPKASLVDNTTTEFWDLALRGTGTATQAIVDAIRHSDGRASLRHQLS